MNAEKIQEISSAIKHLELTKKFLQDFMGRPDDLVRVEVFHRGSVWLTNKAICEAVKQEIADTEAFLRVEEIEVSK